jgi:hypothetical protein
MDGNSPVSKKIKLSDELVIRDVNDLPIDLLANQIFSFVGPRQYRMVGTVCRNFDSAYRQAFPKITTRYKTRYNMSSMKNAKICWEEAPLSDRSLLHRLAREECWYFYVRLDVLTEDDHALLSWILDTFVCSFDVIDGVLCSCKGFLPCVVAARHGNLELLQWAHSIGCE